MSEMDSGAIEMCKTGHTPLPTSEEEFVDDDEVIGDADEPLAWATSQVRRQNRCFFTALVLIGILAIVYIMGGASLAQDDALQADKYEAESGILTDGFSGVKEQDQFEKEHSGNIHSHDWWASHDKRNPFGNENAVEHGSDALSRLRWNASHPGQRFPGNGGLDKRHPEKGGKNQGKNEIQPGNRPARPNNGRPGGNSNGLRPGKPIHRPNEHDPGRSSVPSAGQTTEGSLAQCDHSTYTDWLAATVTLHDGVKYEVVERIEHDSQAFV